MAPSLVLIIDQAIRLRVVVLVLVAVTEEQRVVVRLAACVMWAQASGVKLIVIGRQAWRVRGPRVGAREHYGAKHGPSPVEARHAHAHYFRSAQA